MAKFGIIFVGFSTEDTVIQSLAPWIGARVDKPGGHEFVICAVSVPFAGFPNDSEDRTVSILQGAQIAGVIDNVITGPKNIPETTARGMALQYLKGCGVDFVWQADSDEIPTRENIKAIADYVAKDEWTTWWRLSLKNYVFDDKHYLVDPFTPPRIHRINAGGYIAHSFSQDNDICYGGRITRDLKPQGAFSSKTIPMSVAAIKHLTWPNSERSYKKILYQTNRGWECSFRWDEKEGLKFNEAFYAARHESLPQIAKDI